MDDLLNKEGLEWIISSIIERAKETVEEYGDENDDFYKGLMQGYYEVLDMIKSRIIIREGDPDNYDLGFRLESLVDEMKARIAKDG